MPTLLNDGRLAEALEASIDAAIVIKISGSGGALFAINQQTGLIAGNGVKLAIAFAAQEQAASGIEPGEFGLSGEEVLAQENVFSAVAIEIGHGDCECGRELGVVREFERFEMVGAIEEEHRGKRAYPELVRVGLLIAENGVE